MKGQDGGVIKYLADAYDESESRGGVSALFWRFFGNLDAKTYTTLLL